MPPEADADLFNFVLGIAGNLAATGIAFLFTYLSRAARRSGKSKARIVILAAVSIMTTAVALFLGLWVASFGAALWIAYPMALVAITPMVLFPTTWVLRASAAGIVEVNQDTKGKVSPGSLLRDSTDGFIFLGTGASKLAAEREVFENAVLSATNARKRVKLLLSNPDEANLKEAARRARRPEDEYRSLVLKTLGLVKELSEKRSADIEVRFYKGVREFRLFFVGNRYVVVSYNVYGTPADDGHPSVVLARDHDRDTRSFYWAFKTYFDREWDAAKRNRWDYEEYL